MTLFSVFHSMHLFSRNRCPPHSVWHLLGPDGLVDHFKSILPLLITLWFLLDRRKKQISANEKWDKLAQWWIKDWIVSVFGHKWHTFRPSLNNQASSYLGCPLCLCLRAITCGIVKGRVSVARPMRSVFEPGWMTTTKLLCICCKIYTKKDNWHKHNNVMHNICNIQCSRKYVETWAAFRGPFLSRRQTCAQERAIPKVSSQYFLCQCKRAIVACNRHRAFDKIVENN